MPVALRGAAWRAVSAILAEAVTPVASGSAVRCVVEWRGEPPVPGHASEVKAKTATPLRCQVFARAALS